MKRVLKWLGIGAVGLVAIAAIVFATRTNPIAMVPGRQLSGEIVLEAVTDWSFTDAHQSIAIETRPAKPHSVTTICIAHEGSLYIPANRAAEKSWPHYVVSDPRVRVKVGDKIYAGRATRVEDTKLRPALIEAAGAKYDFEMPQEPGALDDVWVFRIDGASADVAARP